MTPELESVVQMIQLARSQLSDVKKKVLADTEKTDQIEDVELALGWALTKLDQLRSE